jgi:hypothetical protein
MNLEVERTDNGFLAKWWEDEAPEPVKHIMVFEETDTEDGEVECFARLLWYVTEHFGMVGSKHDKYRIRITTENENADTLYPQRED